MKLRQLGDRARSINKIINKLSGKHWLELMLNSYLESRDDDKELLVKEYFSPSLANNCPRYLQFLMDAIAQESKRSGQQQRELDVGKDMHARYTRYFREMGVLKGADIEFRIENPPIHAYIDNIISCNKQEWLIELKTRRQKVAGVDWEDFKTLNPEYIIQWQLYAKYHGPTQGMVVVENKNDLRLKIFDMTLDEALLIPILNKWIDVRNSRANKSIVDIPGGVCPNPIYCSYKKRCTEIERMAYAQLT